MFGFSFIALYVTQRLIYRIEDIKRLNDIYVRIENTLPSCNDRNAFSLCKGLRNSMHGLVEMYVMR